MQALINQSFGVWGVFSVVEGEEDKLQDCGRMRLMAKVVWSKSVEGGGKRYEFSIKVTDGGRAYVVIGEKREVRGGRLGFLPPVVFEETARVFAAGVLETVKLMLDEEKIEELKERPQMEKRTDQGVSGSAAETVRLYGRGLKVGEIVRIRGLTRQTVVGHLLQWYLGGGEFRVREVVSRETEEMVRRAVDKVGMERLRPIKDLVGDEVGYEQIRLVVAMIRRESRL